MAGEEDVELRDLVAQTLEAKGVLGKIRAELRASVFAALEEQDSQERTHPLVNEKLQKYLKTKEGQLATGLVREFLEFFELDFTCAVFDPETNVLDTYSGREKLARDIGIDSKTSTTSPLLASVLQRSTSQSPFLRQLHFPEAPHPTSSTFAATKASFPLPTITEAVRSTVPLVTDSIPSLTTSSKTSAVGESIHLGSESRKDTLTTVTGSTQGSSSARVFDSKLNSNENSNLRLGSVPASHPKAPLAELGKPTLGEGISANIPGVHTELGEVFVNSSHDKHLGLTDEGIGKQMKQLEEVESSREELDDFFDTARLDLLPKDKAKQLRSEDKGVSAAGKKAESLSSLKGAPVLTTNGGNPLEFGSRVSKLATSDGAGGDESHSEDDISEQLEEGSGKYETTDYTISEHSMTGGQFDHTEPVQS